MTVVFRSAQLVVNRSRTTLLKISWRLSASPNMDDDFKGPGRPVSSGCD